MHDALQRAVVLLLAATLVACTDSRPSPSVVPSGSGPLSSQLATPSASAGTPTFAPSAIATPSATATPEPPLSVAPPSEADERVVAFTVTPDVPAGADGTLTVTVTNESDARIDDIVLRWATDLDATLYLAPFARDPGRIVDGGPPLVQPWTKWVVGPGERGEPAGTTSLGWGPIDVGATLEIPILVTRRAAGPVSFDLQFLAGNAILSSGSEPAETRVDIP